MNKENGGQCNTKGDTHGNRYGIEKDSQGNNEVTGEGSAQSDDKKKFTCVALEVFAV